MSPLPRVFFVAAAFCVFATSTRAENWPAWRGAAGDGISAETKLPLKWSASENVKWSVPLPERGNSTPIVWGDRVFITQNVGDRRTVICFDRKNGQQLWQEGPTGSASEKSHPTNPYCSASPVTDGERVIAWFGSAGLWCWDVEGKEQWHLDLGVQDHEWGYAGSPVIEGDLCFLNFGPGERTFLIAVEKKTGKKVWQVNPPPTHPGERTDNFAGKGGVIGSWSTPVIVSMGDRKELVMTWPETIVAYDPKSGKELWSCGGMNPLLYTSPMVGDGLVVGSGGYGGSTVAVKAGGSGDMTAKRLWQKVRDKQRIGSGVIKDGYLYVLNTPGTAQCIDLKNGETKWEERLVGPSGRSESWSGLVLSGDRVYAPNQASDCTVFKASPTFEKLAVNSLSDGLTNSSIAISDGDLFIRTHKHLWCIGEPN